MEKLRALVLQHHRWSGLSEYIDRIEASASIDFSLALENSKAMIETISKELCQANDVVLKNEDFHQIVRCAFSALGYSNSNNVSQISRSLTTIALQVGTLRNQISPTSHGRTLDELKNRNSQFDEMTKDFLIDSTLSIAVFLIRAFEERKSTVESKTISDEETMPAYEDNEEFNDFWDESFGEFAMGEYSYTASEIFYNVDLPAYQTEYKIFLESEGDE
ncbi:abortive infection family protein [Pseudomonas sp. UBA7530]|uniref:abortive infection family protein n=1 Tax=Pseudomonas sp. UBA7530 TaxID=1947341 RepID=UPI0025D5338B|nr:abortive infection family protein [Pseudomonas sp. UBA7530]